jgi:hypothetical protein
MSKDVMASPASQARHEHRDGSEADLAQQRRALHERAEQLGATADELQATLDALALQAEVVLHRLRGGNLH